MFSVKKVGIVVAGVLFAAVSAVMADDASSGTQTTLQLILVIWIVNLV